MSDLTAGKIIAIHGIGTSQDDEEAYVEVTMHDGKRYMIAFDEHIANQLAISFLAASNHLLSKKEAAQDKESTLIPGQPIPLSSGNATVAQFGPERVVVLDLKTDQGLSLMFSMSPRSAEVFSKRLASKKISGKLPAQKGRIH